MNEVNYESRGTTTVSMELISSKSRQRRGEGVLE